MPSDGLSSDEGMEWVYLAMILQEGKTLLGRDRKGRDKKLETENVRTPKILGRSLPHQERKTCMKDIQRGKVRHNIFVFRRMVQATSIRKREI